LENSAGFQPELPGLKTFSVSCADELPGILVAGGDAGGVELEHLRVEAVLTGAAHELGAEHGVEAALPMLRPAVGEAAFLVQPLLQIRRSL